MSRDFLNQLPVELRLIIFRLAAGKDGDMLADSQSHQYRPFEAVPYTDTYSTTCLRFHLAILRALTLVCKDWNEIATEMMYTSIRVEHGTAGLVKAVSRKLNGASGNGGFVRLIEISPNVSDIDPHNPYFLYKILQSCPGVEIIRRVRRTAEDVQTATQIGTPTGRPQIRCPRLPSVKRIDWWLPGRCASPSNEYIRGLLWDLLQRTPNLSYLTLSDFATILPDPQEGYEAWYQRRVITLPPSLESLTTLQIDCHKTPLTAIPPHTLPSLVHLIIFGCASYPVDFFKELGPQIRTLEVVVLGLNSILVSNLAKFLTIFKNLQRLYLDVDKGAVANIVQEMQGSALGGIGIHVPPITFPSLREISVQFWSDVIDQSLPSWICETLVAPKLRKITFCMPLGYIVEVAVFEVLNVWIERGKPLGEQRLFEIASTPLAPKHDRSREETAHPVSVG